MGLFSFRRKTEEKALTASPGVLEAVSSGQFNPYPALGGTNLNSRVVGAWERGVNATYGWMYATQPAVRSVVDYIATNVSQLTLRVFQVVNEDERKRVPDHPAALTMRYPREGMSSEAFVFRLVIDKLVYDNAYFVKFPGLSNNQRVIERVQPNMVTVRGGRFSADSYWLWRDDGSWYGPVPPKAIFHWYGYDPEDPLMGRSKLETLRQELASDSAIQAALVELAKGGLKPGHIERPNESPEWSFEDMKRFLELYKAAKKDPQGTPLLDEGMKWVAEGIAPKDAEVIAARQFTREEVAREYGMEAFPPQTEDERRQFYSDVLAPLIHSLACQLNVSLLQQEYKATDHFFEFDLNEKAYSDPWKLWQVFTAAGGGPFMTRDEIRSLIGLPPFGGPADELIVPMNVTEEDPNSPSLPAPNVMPPQDPNKPPQDGSYRENPKALNGDSKAVPLAVNRRQAYERRNHWAKQYEDVFTKNFAHQQQVIRSAKGKAITDERFVAELTRDLLNVSAKHFKAEGDHAAFRMASTFDPAYGHNWLASKAEKAAKKVNKTTQEQISADGSDAAFALAKENRAPAAGMAYATDVAAFASKVAIEQAPEKRMVVIDGGDCPVCAEYQGAWPAEDVPGWPSFHPGCNCVASPS